MFDSAEFDVVKSKIMPDLVDDRRPDFVPDFVLGGSVPFERFLKNENDVGRVVAVVRAALSVGDAVVKAEQIPGGAEPHVFDDLGGGEVFDQNGHVLDPTAEILREAVDRLGDQLLEPFPG